jgi:hypothetical protein
MRTGANCIHKPITSVILAQSRQGAKKREIISTERTENSETTNALNPLLPQLTIYAYSFKDAVVRKKGMKEIVTFQL